MGYVKLLHKKSLKNVLLLVVVVLENLLSSFSMLIIGKNELLKSFKLRSHSNRNS